MSKGKYKSFAKRLIDAMKLSGHSASRSPSGICMKTLAEATGASEQICRRYIRGDALPDYDKMINLAAFLKVSPGWLVFGEGEPNQSLGVQQSSLIDDDLLHYILSKSQQLFQKDKPEDYAGFVVGLVQELREIDTSKANLEKIINLAVNPISYKEKQNTESLAG